MNASFQVVADYPPLMGGMSAMSSEAWQMKYELCVCLSVCVGGMSAMSSKDWQVDT